MSTSYTIALVAATVGIVPVFGWLWFVAKRDGLTIGNIDLLIKVFFWGVLAAIPASIIEIVIIETNINSQFTETMQQIWFHKETLFVLGTFLSAMFAAFVEEVVKAIGIAVSLFRKKIVSANDGMMYGMVIGLAFAVTENGVYFAAAMQEATGIDFLGIVLLRFILSTSAHIIYSGTMGAFFGKAKMAQNTTGKIMFVALGLILPILIHIVFNSLLGSPYGWVVVIIIAIGFVLLWMQYSFEEKKRGIKIK